MHLGVSNDLEAQFIAEGFDHSHPEGVVLADGNNGEVIFRTSASQFAWGGHCQEPGTSISFETRNTEAHLSFNEGSYLLGNYVYSRFDDSTEPPDGANKPSRTIDMSPSESRVILSLFESTNNVNTGILLRDQDQWWCSQPVIVAKYLQGYNREKRISIDPKTLTWTAMENTVDMDEVDDGGDVPLTFGQEGTPDWSTIEGMGIMAMINSPGTLVAFSGMSLTDDEKIQVNIDVPMKNSDVAFIHKPTPLEKFDVYGGAKAVYWSQGWNKDYTALTMDYGVRDIPAVSMSVIQNTQAQKNPDLKKSICRDLWGEETIYGSPIFPSGQVAFMCIRKPEYLAYVKDYAKRRVYDVGAREALMDSPSGSNGSKMLFRDEAGCFCDDCNQGFNDWLQANYSSQELSDMGISDLGSFDYRELLKSQVSNLSQYIQKFDNGQLPYIDLYITYQQTPARDFFTEVRDYMSSIHPDFTFTSNTFNLLKEHLYLAEEVNGDFHGAETELYMQNPSRFGNQMLRLKLADDLGIRIVTSGVHWDWNYVRQQNLVDVVKPIIAGHYASGHQLAVPDYYRWIEPDWYGSMPDYAPFYRFVRENAFLFDDYETVEQVGVIMDNSVNGKYTGDPVFRNDFETIGRELFDQNIPFGVATGADGLFYTKEFTEAELTERFQQIILPRNTALEGSQLEAVNNLSSAGKIYNWDGSMDSFLPKIESWVSCDQDEVWVLPRTQPADTNAPVIVHMLNRDISLYQDMVYSKNDINIHISDAIVKRPVFTVKSHSPGETSTTLSFTRDADGIAIAVPELEYWNVIEIIYQNTPAARMDRFLPEVIFYPNPVTERFYIKGLTEKTDISVRNIHGSIIKRTMVEPGGSIDISGLAPGLYFIRIRNSSQNIIKKIIKQ